MGRQQQRPVQFRARPDWLHRAAGGRWRRSLAGARERRSRDGHGREQLRPVPWNRRVRLRQLQHAGGAVGAVAWHRTEWHHAHRRWADTFAGGAQHGHGGCLGRQCVQAVHGHGWTQRRHQGGGGWRAQSGASQCGNGRCVGCDKFKHLRSQPELWTDHRTGHTVQRHPDRRGSLPQHGAQEQRHGGVLGCGHHEHRRGSGLWPVDRSERTLVRLGHRGRVVALGRAALRWNRGVLGCGHIRSFLRPHARPVHRAHGAHGRHADRCGWRQHHGRAQRHAQWLRKQHGCGFSHAERERHAVAGRECVAVGHHRAARSRCAVGGRPGSLWRRGQRVQRHSRHLHDARRQQPAHHFHRGGHGHRQLDPRHHQRQPEWKHLAAWRARRRQRVACESRCAGAELRHGQRQFRTDPDRGAATEGQVPHGGAGERRRPNGFLDAAARPADGWRSGVNRHRQLFGNGGRRRNHRHQPRWLRRPCARHHVWRCSERPPADPPERWRGQPWRHQPAHQHSSGAHLPGGGRCGRGWHA